jgi:hypothetical protein
MLLGSRLFRVQIAATFVSFVAAVAYSLGTPAQRVTVHLAAPSRRSPPPSSSPAPVAEAAGAAATARPVPTAGHARGCRPGTREPNCTVVARTPEPRPPTFAPFPPLPDEPPPAQDERATTRRGASPTPAPSPTPTRAPSPRASPTPCAPILC